MATLKLNRSIYTEASINEAITTYGEYGSLEISDDNPDGYILINVDAEEGINSEELAGEFANYALAASFEAKTE